jgi:hypothetical protein
MTDLALKSLLALQIAAAGRLAPFSRRKHIRPNLASFYFLEGGQF